MKETDPRYDEIVARLTPLFQSILGVPVFNLELNMSDVETWDSLEHIRLLAGIENTFNIEIAFEDTVEMTSGRAILETIAQYLARN